MKRVILALLLFSNIAIAESNLTSEVARLSEALSVELSPSIPMAIGEGQESKFIMDQIWFQVSPNVTFQIPGGIVALTVAPVVEFFFKKKLPAGYVLYNP